MWKEESQGAWGVFDLAHGDTWTERPQVVAWISRVHAARIAGDVIANAFDHATGALHLTSARPAGTCTTSTSPTAAATSASCNGEPLAPARDAATGLVSTRATAFSISRRSVRVLRSELRTDEKSPTNRDTNRYCIDVHRCVSSVQRMRWSGAMISLVAIACGPGDRR